MSQRLHVCGQLNLVMVAFAVWRPTVHVQFQQSRPLRLHGFCQGKSRDWTHVVACPQEVAHESSIRIRNHRQHELRTPEIQHAQLLTPSQCLDDCSGGLSSHVVA